MKNENLTQEILKRLKPFKQKEDFTELIESIQDKRVVMLGEASHGTQEYYEWRYLISRELIENHGFHFISVEGDWPPCQKVNEFIHQYDTSQAYEILASFDRWPTWMWANTEVVELVEWMKGQNIGFHGLDVYSFFDSIHEVLHKLKSVDPHLARRAVKYYSCFDSFQGDEKNYARSLFHLPEGCRPEILSALQDLLKYRMDHPSEYPYALFDATQNARIVKNAERYYRAMALGDEDSWNVRDQHMMDTLDILLDHYGPDSKGIVWAHNTHIGDYRATDMILSQQVNLGGLAREKYGNEQVALIGLGSHHGKVIASYAWDGPMEVLEVPDAKEGSIEDYFHAASSESGENCFFIMMDESSRETSLSEYRGHRAIGVVYHPEWESRGNYVPTSLAKRYDAFIYFDETHALTPLKIRFDPHKFPETYPFIHE